MLNDYVLGQASVVLRVKLRNSTSSSGAGLTGLTGASTGLVIAAIADVEASTTAYTATGATIGTITTLGTFAAPSAGQCNLREIDATNHPGLYELQLADTRFAVASSKSLTISISGATNLAQCDVVISLRAVNPYSATAFVSSVPSVAGAVGSVTGNTPQTGDSFARIGAAGAGLTGITGVTLAATQTGVTIPTVTTVTNPVELDKTQTLSAARSLDTIADTALTINDALHCAIAGAAGQETVVGTAYTVKTPHTATAVRSFALDSATAPTSRS